MEEAILAEPEKITSLIDYFINAGPVASAVAAAIAVFKLQDWGYLQSPKLVDARAEINEKNIQIARLEEQLKACRDRFEEIAIST